MVAALALDPNQREAVRRLDPNVASGPDAVAPPDARIAPIIAAEPVDIAAAAPDCRPDRRFLSWPMVLQKIAAYPIVFFLAFLAPPDNETRDR